MKKSVVVLALVAGAASTQASRYQAPPMTATAQPADATMPPSVPTEVQLQITSELTALGKALLYPKTHFDRLVDAVGFGSQTATGGLPGTLHGFYLPKADDQGNDWAIDENSGAFAQARTIFQIRSPNLQQTNEYEAALYFPVSKVVTCCESAHLPFYSRWGSVRGTVTFDTGEPAPPSFEVAAIDPTNSGEIYRVVSTANGGDYTFNLNRISDLLGPSLHQQTFGWTFLEEYPFDETNNWGLPVAAPTGADTPGQKTWTIRTGEDAQPAIVRSGESTVLNFVVPVTAPSDQPDPPDPRPPSDEQPPDESPQPPKPQVKEPPGDEGCPVSVTNGNVFFDQSDAVFTGLRSALSMDRGYNSQVSASDGLFGTGWRTRFDKRVTPVDASNPNHLKLQREDGSLIYYNYSASEGAFRPYLPASDTTKLIAEGGGYRRTFASGGHEMYGSDGRITRLVDALGNSTVLGYSGNRLETITDPGGRAFTFSYEGTSERPRLLKGPDGQQIAEYSYSGETLSAVDYADGTGYRYSYQPSAGRMLLTSMTDREDGVIETHSYDAEGRGLTSAIAGNEESLVFSYSPGRTIVSGADGGTRTYDWATVAGRKRVTKLAGCTACGGGIENQEWSYDNFGRITGWKTNGEVRESYAYNSSHDITSMSTRGGISSTFSYDSRRRLTGASRPGVAATSHSFIGGGLGTSTAGGRSSGLGYDSSGRIVSSTAANGQTTTFARNASGDLTGISAPLGRNFTFTHDAFGRVNSVSNAIGQRAEIAYDPRGRVRSATRPDGKSGLNVYDTRGRLAETRDVAGRRTQFRYDAQGRVILVIDPAGGATRYEYTPLSQLKSLSDAKGQKTVYSYDTFGRLKVRQGPDGTREEFTYDNEGRLLQAKNQRNITSTFTYDSSHGQILSRSFSEGTPAITYSYDNVTKRLQSMSNGTDTLTWTYDPATGEVLSEASAKNGTVVGYTYDDAGRRASLSLDGDPFATYAYDGANRLTTIAREARTFGFTYDTLGRRTSMTYPNGVITTYSYDDLSRLTQIQALLGATVITNSEYAYDTVGNRTSKAHADFSEAYKYDILDRLLDVNRDGSAGVEDERWRFAYDRVGNRTSTQVGTGDLASRQYANRNQFVSQVGGGSLVIAGALSEPSKVTVNGEPARQASASSFEATIPVAPGANQFTVEAVDGSGNPRSDTYEVTVSGAAATYTYDPAGNLLSRLEGGVTWGYTWNALNQLVGVAKDGAALVAYAYDPLGRRVEKVVHAAGGAATTTWTYDGLEVLQEKVTAMGVSTASLYLHGPGIDVPLEKASSDAPRYFHADGLGSILRITNDAGVVVHEYRYDAWGWPERGAERAGFAFTGREWDPETGLYYYRARYYDPKAGRFISEDPIGFFGGINVFAYASNAPTTGRDPLGLLTGPQHAAAYAQVLGGVLTPHQLQVLTAASEYVDTDQSPGSAYKHGMTPGGDILDRADSQGAAADYAKFVHDNLNLAAMAGDNTDASLWFLGQAMHALSDAAARGHKGFQHWHGMDNEYWHPVETLRHILGDYLPSSQELSDIYDALSWAYREYRRRLQRTRCR